jgi:hypothetical protein
MPRVLPLLGAFALPAGSGTAHRLWTGAWAVSGEPAASAARLADVPRTVGDWDGEAVEVDARQLAQAEAAGHLSRRYVHPLCGIHARPPPRTRQGPLPCPVTASVIVAFVQRSACPLDNW